MSRDNTTPDRKQVVSVVEEHQGRWHALRPRRPASIWGWLLWLLAALLFYLLISYVLASWWYRPAPTDIPPGLPGNNTKGT